MDIEQDLLAEDAATLAEEHWDEELSSDGNDAVELFEEVDLWVDSFADKLISLRSLPNPNPPTRQPRNPPRIDFGQVTTVNRKKEQEGLGNLVEDRIFRHRQGRGALVQYDPRGNVRMTVLRPDMQSIQWQGRLGSIQMPSRTASKQQREQQIEDRVRALVGRRTRQTFEQHRSNQPGTDLVPQPRRAPRVLRQRTYRAQGQRAQGSSSNLARPTGSRLERLRRQRSRMGRPRSFDEFFEEDF